MTARCSTGSTSLSLLSASQGGSGSALSQENVAAFIEDWAESRTDTTLGSAQAAHLGFAAAAQENGRTTAVAIFGGRD